MVETSFSCEQIYVALVRKNVVSMHVLRQIVSVIR